MTRVSGVMLAMLVCSLGWSADYEVRFMPETQTAEIRISIPKQDKLVFQMPAWIPGDYELFNYGQTVKSIRFRDGGKDVKAVANNSNKWESLEQANQVIYTIGTSVGNFCANLAFRGDVTVIGGGAFGWLEGHSLGETKVKFFTQPGQEVYAAMKPGTEPGTFVAPSYVRLVDSPAVIGKGFLVADGAIRVVAYGNSSGVDPQEYQEIGNKVAAEAKKMLGGSFSEKYTFFLDFGGSGGGLEHEDCTFISLFTKNPRQAAGIMFHEFFHAYNVKRIRPEAIWDFDFSKAPQIDSLWWLEGVTDYYSSVFQVRAGLTPRESFLNQLGQNLVREKNRSATYRTSAIESSRRIFEVAGSQGYGGLSYYSKGWLIGAALDLSIRSESSGKYSLDDVMRGLWANAQEGKGYPESMIRELCVKFGGEATGAIYDESVTKASVTPLAGVLAKAGLKLETNAVVADDGAAASAKTVGSKYPLLIPGS